MNTINIRTLRGALTMLLGVVLWGTTALFFAHTANAQYRLIKKISTQGVNKKGDSLFTQYEFSWNRKQQQLRSIYIMQRIGQETTHDTITLSYAKNTVRINQREMTLKLNRRGLCETTQGEPSQKVLHPLVNSTATYQKGQLITFDCLATGEYQNYEWDALGNIKGMTVNGLPSYSATYTQHKNNVLPNVNGQVEPAHFLDHLFGRQCKYWIEKKVLQGQFNSNILHEVSYTYQFDKHGDPVHIVESSPYGTTQHTEITIEYLTR